MKDEKVKITVNTFNWGPCVIIHRKVEVVGSKLSNFELQPVNHNISSA